MTARGNEFTLIGTDEITGERYARSAPDANFALREIIRAHMDVWCSTTDQIATAIGLDELDFKQFMENERGAELDWVTRLAAYTGLTPAQVLACRPGDAHSNALAHLELIADGDELTSMLETLIVAKRSGMLAPALQLIGSVSDGALNAEGRDSKRMRRLARQLAAAR